MTILEYLQKENMTQIEFSKVLGIHEVTLSRIISRGSARADVLVKIENATNGEVGLTDMVILK